MTQSQLSAQNESLVSAQKLEDEQKAHVETKGELKRVTEELEKKTQELEAKERELLEALHKVSEMEGGMLTA